MSRRDIRPTAFLAGAQKSGTTSLALMLAEHDEIIVSSPKEPMIFSSAAYPAALDGIPACFAAARPRHRVRIDASTSYMVDPLVPGRIRAHLGASVKFIFVLRDPVDRALSAYNYFAARRQDRRPQKTVFGTVPTNLEQALIDENDSLARAAEAGLVRLHRQYSDPLWNYRYLRNSLYSEHLARFGTEFGADNILCTGFDFLLRQPEAARRQIYRFLGVADIVAGDQALPFANETLPGLLTLPLNARKCGGLIARALLPNGRYVAFRRGLDALLASSERSVAQIDLAGWKALFSSQIRDVDRLNDAAQLAGLATTPQAPSWSET